MSRLSSFRNPRHSHCSLSCRGYTHRFFVRSVVQRRRAFRGLNTTSEEIRRNAHAHSFRFSRVFFSLPAKRRPLEPRTRKSDACRPTCPISSSKKLGQHLGRGYRCVWPRHARCSQLAWLTSLTIEVFGTTTKRSSNASRRILFEEY